MLGFDLNTIRRNRDWPKVPVAMQKEALESVVSVEAGPGDSIKEIG